MTGILKEEEIEAEAKGKTPWQRLGWCIYKPRDFSTVGNTRR